MRKSVIALMFVVLGAPFIAQAAEEARPFITSEDLDLSKYIPAPPANDSAQTKAELDELIQIQKNSTAAQKKMAIDDSNGENVWRFSDVMGPEFVEAKLPKTAEFFSRLVATEDVVNELPKKVFHRPRPYMLNDNIHPLTKATTSGSWPSGHSTLGYLMATELSKMVPEKRDALFARADVYASNRLISGFHYRSDTVMGRTTGALIALKSEQQPDFQPEFDAAKAELRAQLGLK
ncbi:phosphatase PAP2 family protein [Klebsiella aerogenes]|nr:phosphatase PAP2 family protein [Klebsiella aerogenes]